MKIQRTSTVSQWMVCLLAICLMALNQTANAQEAGENAGGPVGGAVFFQHFEGSGTPRGAVIFLNGQNVGASLVNFCDTNQDGTATLAEMETALLNWFQQNADAVTGAFSEAALVIALQSVFPSPQPPLGVPPLPKGQTLPDLLAKKLMTTVDTNHDALITSAEGIAFLDDNFSQWDAEGSGSLDSSEFAAAFAQLMPPPPQLRPEAGEDQSLSARADQ